LEKAKKDFKNQIIPYKLELIESLAATLHSIASIEK
jgi:hypothetical protein